MQYSHFNSILKYPCRLAKIQKIVMQYIDISMVGRLDENNKIDDR
ncbi:hypothetical protein B0P06_005059 [Clostridium saccharoperbutylacetonicum]|nr:hypothetical protein [Clostridium saccharoperbutylacetonicum]NRT62582.1 hypothetical protein [Clostridium saccharoperbutylacetonicum]NSB25930.1 hypothetical protein [Clostridium saccharoperbutylacetonicum]NSB45288.1 hypothetical protein [Clostridium saccharoperbutylacetonicum]